MKSTFCEPNDFIECLEEVYGSDQAGDDEYRELQHHLMENPDSGDVIQGAGGVRKIRWSARGHGKRGGARFIYLHVPEYDRFLMLAAYAKGDQVDLSTEECQALADYARQYKEYLRSQH